MSNEQKTLDNKDEKGILKAFIEKLIPFNVPLIFSLIYVIIRIPVESYKEKSRALFLSLLISEEIYRLIGFIMVIVVCFTL